MAATHKVIPGEDVQFVGPYFPLHSLSAETRLNQNRINAALTDLRAEGLSFRNGVQIYYPAADFAGQENATAPKINWYLCVPAVGFILAYWGVCFLADASSSCLWCLQCWSKHKKEQKEQEKEEKEEEKEKSSTMVEMNGLHVQKRKSFVKRDVELESKKKKMGSAGHLRTLFADGPEFIGLATEVHSIHGGMARLESMVASMLMAQNEKMIASMMVQNNMQENKEEEVASFEEVNTSDEEAEDEAEKNEAKNEDDEISQKT